MRRYERDSEGHGVPAMNKARIFVNSVQVETEAPEGRPLLDFVREELGLRGTKEGCREGDCGACAVLIGEFHEGKPRYRAHPSCLAFVGELDGRHLVTIEGMAAAAEEAGLADGLTPVMRALLEENGSQCGFCSPGFVTSLTAWLLEGPDLSEEGAVKAIDGNLCRCTGYASIRRAARLLVAEFADLPVEAVERIRVLVERGAMPVSALSFSRGETFGTSSVSGFALRGEEASPPAAPSAAAPSAAASLEKTHLAKAGLPLGGGSDLAIKAPSSLLAGRPRFLRNEERLCRITREADSVVVGAATSVRDFFGSSLVREAVPGIEGFETRFASTLVRNRATVGGNIANASPIADLTPILLALDARLRIEGPAGEREAKVDGFFAGYRRIDLHDDEIIASIVIPRLSRDGRFNFEKLSKRKNLDIATVNTAVSMRFGADGLTVEAARFTSGGVAPVPMILQAASRFAVGKIITIAMAIETADLAVSEVKPIDDVRGSAAYRSQGLRRLILAHFVALRLELARALEGELMLGDRSMDVAKSGRPMTRGPAEGDPAGRAQGGHS